MRIITGKAKGAKLKSPQGNSTRPTTDRVKESIFNILGSRVENARVLDLFAGTGGLGLEALSRGAARAVFIDQDIHCVKLIKDNAQHTKLVEYAEIYKREVVRALDLFAQSAEKFDLIFCDPPYNKGLVSAVLAKLDLHDILDRNGLIIMEHSRHEVLENDWGNLWCKRTERYGETLVSFLGFKQEVI